MIEMAERVPDARSTRRSGSFTEPVPRILIGSGPRTNKQELDNTNRRPFTIILDFEGTTSASQVEAISVDDAVRLSAKGLNRAGSYGLTAHNVRALPKVC